MSAWKSDVRTIHCFQCFDHCLPAMHSTPAYLTFCSEFFAIVGCYITGFPKRLGYQFCVVDRISCPLLRRACRINPHNAIWSYAKFAQAFSNMTGFANHLNKLFAFFFGTHCRSTPDGSDKASNLQIQTRRLYQPVF